MATSLRKLSTFAVFHFLAFLLLSTNYDGVQAEELCGKPSGTWKGLCFDYQSSHCDQQCREREGLVGGLCIGLECYCKFHCT